MSEVSFRTKVHHHSHKGNQLSYMMTATDVQESRHWYIGEHQTPLIRETVSTITLLFGQLACDRAVNT